MSNPVARLLATINEKAQKTRKFKPSVVVPWVLRPALEGKLNCLTTDNRKRNMGSLNEIQDFNLGEIEKLSSIKDSGGESKEELKRSDDSLAIEDDDNASASSFNIVKKCQMLNCMILDSQNAPPSFDHRKSADVNDYFDFMADLKQDETRHRINKRNIEWSSILHDIYEPDFSSGDNIETIKFHPASMTDLNAKTIHLIHINSVNAKKSECIVQYKNPIKIKKFVSKPEANIMKRVNTPMSLVPVKAPGLDFKKKGKPRAESIKPTKTKKMSNLVPQFKSKLLASNNITAKFTYPRQTAFDMKDQPEIKKNKAVMLALKLNPQKSFGTFDERFKILAQVRVEAKEGLNRKIGSLRQRPNMSTMSNNQKNKSASIHF